MAAFSCGKKADKGPVIALVNLEPVYQSELDFLSRYTNLEYSFLGSGTHATQDFLNKIIEKKIILQEAKKKGITLSYGELEAYLKHISDEFFTKKFKDLLKERLISFEDWKEFMAGQALAEKLGESEMKMVSVEPVEISRYYYGHLSEFMHAEQARAYQILVKTETEIKEVQNRLERGEEFEKIARIKSISPESEKGGDLGYFSKEQMPPEISEAVFKLAVGKISGPVHTAYGYHLLKLTERRKKGTATLAEAEPVIIKKLKAEKKETYFKEWIKELAKNAEVKISKDLSGVVK